MSVCVICMEESGCLCVCGENEHVFVKEPDREQERKSVCFGVSIVCLIGVQRRCYSFS